MKAKFKNFDFVFLNSENPLKKFKHLIYTTTYLTVSQVNNSPDLLKCKYTFKDKQEFASLNFF